MKQIVPYLAFNGNCREAMEFYKECLGGELEFMNWGDAPEDACGEGMPKIEDDKVMHGCLHDGEFTLMACDQPMQFRCIAKCFSEVVGCFGQVAE